MRQIVEIASTETATDTLSTKISGVSEELLMLATTCHEPSAVTLTVLTAIGCLIFPIYLEAEYKKEFAILFGATLLFGFIYLFVAVDARCRVCSCHLFYSRRCLKHVKAHRILGGFPMLAQTIHILLFHWFRCMYCGTAIRLKDES